MLSWRWGPPLVSGVIVSVAFGGCGCVIILSITFVSGRE
jgi:hypothetical protein